MVRFATLIAKDHGLAQSGLRGDVDELGVEWQTLMAFSLARLGHIARGHAAEPLAARGTRNRKREGRDRQN